MTIKFIQNLLLAASLIALTACGDKHISEAIADEQIKVVLADELIDLHHCLSCHLPSNEMDVPSWRDVAEKYKGDKKAENFLVSKVGQGGAGSWGNMDMPPYFELSELERRVIVRWILARDTTKPASKKTVKPRKVSTQKN